MELNERINDVKSLITSLLERIKSAGTKEELREIKYKELVEAYRGLREAFLLSRDLKRAHRQKTLELKK